ncbi:MAG TPA: exodeoxyribonuclease VII small subunit [Lachnospiraceae bacterium]|nr:exodeoxyribonuclease VII small subunit [Lachnospiraceae bacterium]
MDEAVKQPDSNGTLEESFAELSEVMEALQKEGLPLEESFRLYQRGMELVRICNARIDTVEKKMLILDEEGDKHEF